MSESQNLISFAQSYLKRRPFDIVHDLEHHQLVMTNCVEIIKREQVPIDKDIILTSAWWHDVEKSYQTANSSDSTIIFFRKTAQELHADSDFIDQCCLTIAQHSFSQSQTTIEGRVLFDADKIEYVNDIRISKLINDFVANPDKYQHDNLQQTHDVWLARLKKVCDMMHFKYSKQTFLSRLKQTEDILEKLQQVLN